MPTFPDHALRIQNSGHQLGEQIRIDIAAGKNDDDVLAARIDTAGQQGSKADRSPGLDHELQFAKSERNRCANFRIRCANALRQQLAIDRRM